MEPLRREVAHQRFAARIGQHAPHLAAEDGRIRQRSALGRVEQLFIGDAAPQEERQARRELQVAERVHLSRRSAGRVLLHAQEEVRIDEQSFQRELDAGVEAALRLRPSVPEELEQRLDVPIRRRPAIGEAGQPRHDPLGARVFLRRGGRIAHEDRPPARRVRREPRPRKDPRSSASGPPRSRGTSRRSTGPRPSSPAATVPRAPTGSGRTRPRPRVVLHRPARGLPGGRPTRGHTAPTRGRPLRPATRSWEPACPAPRPPP